MYVNFDETINYSCLFFFLDLKVVRHEMFLCISIKSEIDCVTLDNIT